MAGVASFGGKGAYIGKVRNDQLGTVFGHEMVHVIETHMVGADGRSQELWSPAAQASAKRQDQCVIRQANAFSPAPGVKMNGENQYSENVADYGGMVHDFTYMQSVLPQAHEALATASKAIAKLFTP